MKQLEELWSSRFHHLMKELGKYGRLIFNDHFSVILFVMLGFMMFFYREQLTVIGQMDTTSFRLPVAVVLAVILAIFSGIGKPLWLMKEADKSYVYAQGEKWRFYWLKGTLVGMLLPMCFNAVLVSLLFPFLNVIFKWDVLQFGQLLVMQLIVVGIHHLNRFVQIYNQQFLKKMLIIILYMGILCVCLVFVSRLVLAVGMIFCLTLLIVTILRIKDVKHKWHDFEFATKTDIERQGSFYKWIGFFAEVKHQRVTVKRRSYLDGIIVKLSHQKKEVEYFLLLRLLFRNTAYSGIWLRVLMFISILLLMTNNIYLSIGLGLIGFYLTVVQLLPMVHFYDTNPFKQVYPVKSMKLSAMKRVSLIILIIQWVIFSFCMLISMKLTYNGLMAIGVLFIGLLLLTFGYVPYWINKKTKKV